MILEDEEVKEWLDEQLKDIPEEVKEITFCFPGEESIKQLKESEEYKGITVHFYSSCWIRDPQLLWRVNKEKNIYVFPWLEEEKECELQVF